MKQQMMKETVTTVYLEQICDQLSEAICLKKGHKVSAIIDMETDPHKILGWCLARVYSDGKLVMDKVGVFKTIMELLKRKKQ
mgnify:CR=1 FL=1